MNTNVSTTQDQIVATDIESHARTIWDYLRLSENELDAESAFLLGAANLYHVYKAIELYRKGLIKYIVFLAKDGTFSNPEWTEPEARIYYRILIEHGIPENYIKWDITAQSTLQEAQQAIPFMRKHSLPIDNIVLITRPMHQRRTFATFKKHHPSINFINIPSDEPFILSQSLITRLIAEIDRLEKYALKGDITPQIIPEKIIIARDYLKNKRSETLTEN